MRETSFIKQNKDKWKEFESILETKDKDPDKLNDLFIQITDDLSYSRTFYPNRSVRVYLNNLAQQVFHSIYKNKKSRLGRLGFFLTDELPQLIYESRIAFRFSFFVFALALAIGALSSAMEPEFCRVILGDRYVDMTLENIESGDPMAVYKNGGQFSTSLGITVNNLRVAFLTFVLGVFFVIGTIAIMISNGIMVGAFQYFFYEHGLLRESALTIWMHGTLEISAIVIAGAAGITMGLGLVLPGTLSRIQAFQLSARRGLKIMVGITPIIMIAGFIEGYFTRFTETPDIIRGLFILACLAFVLGYFVIYPVYKARKGFQTIPKGNPLAADRAQRIQTGGIHSISEIFSDVFLLFRKHFPSIALTSAGGAVLFCAMIFPFISIGAEEPFAFQRSIDDLFSFNTFTQFFNSEQLPQLSGANWLFYALISFVTLRVVYQEVKGVKLSNRSMVSRFLKIGVVNFLVVLMFTYTSNFGPLLFLFSAPFWLLWMYLFFAEDKNLVDALSRSFQLLQGNYGRTLGLSFLFGALAMVLFSILNSSLLWLYFEVITWNLSLEKANLIRLQTIMATFTGVFMMGLFSAMFLKGMALQYYTLLEIHEAPDLLAKVENLRSSQRIQGMIKEN